MKVIAVWYRKYEFASLSGILLLVGNVGGIAAAYPMVAMCNSMGLQNTYIVLAILTFAVAVAAGLLVRNHPSEMQLPSIESIVAEETNKSVAESTSGSVPMVEALKRTFTSGRKFWPLAVWYFFTYGTIMLWQALQAGMYYRNVYGWDSTQFGLLLTLVGVGMVLGCPLAGYLSDKLLRSRKKVICFGAVCYTAVWTVIWLTAGDLASWGMQAAINFCFGFFGGFFVVCYAQIKELFPISMAGTSTAALNLFPFAGGALFTIVGGLIVKTEVASEYLGEYRTLWLLAVICMLIATFCAFISVENKADIKQ